MSKIVPALAATALLILPLHADAQPPSSTSWQVDSLYRDDGRLDFLNAYRGARETSFPTPSSSVSTSAKPRSPMPASTTDAPTCASRRPPRSGLGRFRLRFGGDVRCTARYGHPVGAAPCLAYAEAGRYVDPCRAAGGRPAGRQLQLDEPAVLRRLDGDLRAGLARSGGRGRSRCPGRRETPCQGRARGGLHPIPPCGRNAHEHGARSEALRDGVRHGASFTRWGD